MSSSKDKHIGYPISTEMWNTRNSMPKRDKQVLDVIAKYEAREKKGFEKYDTNTDRQDLTLVSGLIICKKNLWMQLSI